MPLRVWFLRGFERLFELLFKSDHVFALFVHVYMITGACFEIAGVSLDPIHFTKQLITLRSQRISLGLHGFQFGALSFLLAKRLLINGYHDGHHQEKQAEFTESNQAAQSAIDMLGWLRRFDVKFFVFHGDAASGRLVELDLHAATEDRVFTQFLLNAQKLVVLGDTVATGKGACLDLAAIGCYSEVGNGVVFSFT